MSDPKNQPPVQGGVKLDEQIKNPFAIDFLKRLTVSSAHTSQSISKRLIPNQSSAASASVPAPIGSSSGYPLIPNHPSHESGSGGGKGNDNPPPSLPDEESRPSWWKLMVLLGLCFFLSFAIPQVWRAYKNNYQEPAPSQVEIASVQPTPNATTNMAPQQAVSSEIPQKPLRSPYRTTFETATMSSCDAVEGAVGNAQVFVQGLKAGPGCAWVEVSYPLDVFMVEGVGFVIEFPYQKDVLGVTSCTGESCVRYLNHVRKSPDVKEKRVLIRVKKDTGNSGYPEGFVKIL